MAGVFRLERLTYLFLLISTLSFAQKQVPELWGQRVHDEAHVLKPETIDLLERQLKIHEDSTSNQIAVLIIQSLDGDILEEYSIRVVEKWKLGKKEKDNGVLLLIAVDDHKMRIEVGEGLEGVLTDAVSNRIIRNEIAPEFRRGNYDAGVQLGVGGIIKAIRGEYQAEASSKNSTWIIVTVLFVIFCIVVLIVAFVNEFRRKGDASAEAKSSNRNPVSKRKKSGTTTIGTGMFSGRSGGSSWSSGGGSSSGGGFSGGGGSFGGGGSSGSW